MARWSIHRRVAKFSLLLLFILLNGVSRQTIAHAQCTDSAGRLETKSYYSDLLAQEMRFDIYLPPCYDEDSVYPVMYLMHGSNRTQEHWESLGLIHALDRGITGALYPPLIAVMPFGDWVANENRFEGEYTWSNVFLTEMMPAIERLYAVRTDKAGRIIGGISRGGFWAFNIAFRYPDLFGGVGGHSPFFDRGHFPLEYNPLNLAETAPNLDTLRIYMDRGQDDYAFFGIDLMHEALTERGIPHEYRVNPQGEHTDDYWAVHIAEYLAFYTAAWENPFAVELPTINHTFDTTNAVDLYIPAVAFPSLQMDITLRELVRVYAGELDVHLILGQSVFDGLTQRGVTLNPVTRIVPDDDLITALWADRNGYTLLPVGALSPRLRTITVDDLLVFDSELTSYPFVFEGQGYQPDDMTRILFSGVTALARYTREAIFENGVEWAGSGIRDVVMRPDYFHISNEVSFAPRCPASNEPVLGGLCAMDIHFPLLTDLDVDIVELSGNHNNDYNFSAYLRTLDFYREADMMTLAGGETLDAARQPLILEAGNTSIALLSCNWNGPDYALATETTPGAAFCDLDWLGEIIPLLKSEHDVVIVTVQYAEYDRARPIQRQVDHFRAVANLGAEVVLGTQAHQPQSFEFFTASDERETFLHYGLGNLFFDQEEAFNVQFFMDEILIYDGRVLGTVLHTGVIEGRARPRWMSPREQDDFLARMFTASEFDDD